MNKAINPRPGLVVCIANGRGEIVLFDPGALARQARIRAEREEQRRKGEGDGHDEE